MKPLQFIFSLFITSVFLFSCSKDKPDTNTNDVLQTATNSTELVKAGEPNCIDPITGNIIIKATTDPTSTSSVSNIKITARTVKEYPMGGYILVYELTRTANKIMIDYKQVHTSCGNPSTQAFAPALSSVIINNLSEGIYPIELKVNGQVNKGSLVVSKAPQLPILQMQTTNGIIVQ